MTEPQVVNALIERRARTAGLIRELESKIQTLRVELTHIDATIRLFARTVEPEDITPIRPIHRSGYFQPGELSKRCLDELRRARGTPMTTVGLAQAIMGAKGFPTDDRVLCSIVMARLRPILRRYWERGLIAKAGGRGDVRWSIR